MANLEEYINYICEHADDLRKPHRIEILQLVLGSGITKTKIKEKGDGSYIKMNDISPDLIILLYNYIKRKLKLQEDELFGVDICLKK